MKNKILISIVGPTAIGKTALSIQLANHFKTEIISADSRQFYKEMLIGTAAPTATELSSAKHHFIHHKSVEEEYNVGAFERDAIRLLEELFSTKDLVIMVGGSGLYVNAVINGLNNFPEINPKIRAFLNKQFTEKGLVHLQRELKHLDPVTYNSISIDNPHRVIRALEVCIGTGRTYASFLNTEKEQRKFKSITIGLTAERSVIYERINHRVDKMMEKGLLEEVKSLLPKQHLNALNSVGYKELFNYLNDEWTLDFAISEIKKNSRRFAKRQLTWFRKIEGISWFDYESEMKIIIDTIEKKLETDGKDIC
ncbi:MAG: tRNA (adenosine(37)-N6)-dimethylallyltransferase MiaA [Aquaticitalea sp.]